MAALTTQVVSVAGIVPTYASAAGGGDTFTNTGNEFLHIKNGSGSPITVTVACTATKYKGATITNQAVSVTNGSELMVKPFAPDITGVTAAITYSAVTSLTIAVVQFQPA